jgi:hypothetical protein
MKSVFFAVFLLSGSFLLAQDNATANGQKESKESKDQITVQGCVGRSSGDYVLTKQNPAMTYELQATGKTRLKHYLGQRVEVTGKESPTMGTSSDAMNKTGSAAPTTINITSIRTIDKECVASQTSSY